MDAVVITYLTDGFPHVSYFTDLSFYLTPQAGLGCDMNNITCETDHSIIFAIFFESFRVIALCLACESSL